MKLLSPTTPLTFCLVLFASMALQGQISNPLTARPHSRIIAEIRESRTVSLTGNRHPLLNTALDLAAAPSDYPMQQMVLRLKSDAAQQSALGALVAAQHDAASPLYHKWLTPEEFGSCFGVSQADFDEVATWLNDHGFTVDEIPAGRRSIVFSGTAAQVQSAFHTNIRLYNAGGEFHYGNSGDPTIPEALAEVVGGVVSMNDIRRQPMHTPNRLLGNSDPLITPFYTVGGTHYMGPADFSTIYNTNPLYGSGIDGTGQMIAIVGRSSIHLSDVQMFRSHFGLLPNSPTIVLNGRDPGVLTGSEEVEAELDVEWAGAVAPNATVKFVVSASTATSDGVDLSAQYIVNNNVAPVMSISFGSCEAAMGAAERSFFNDLWQQAAAEGITVFVASGDSGAAGCDYSGASVGRYGRAVNGLCSTPYSVCVGGTQFSDTSNPGLYWASGNAASTMGSAISYIPEAVWNESGSTLAGSGGGASAYYTKPLWQIGPGVPADGKRDVPDVSLTAAGHDGYLLYLNGSLQVVGGTSASSPAFAGLMALVNQKTAGRQGNANTNFYVLAQKQSQGGDAIFHDIITGTNTVPGVTGYAAGFGYDLATGLGSVDANELVNHWGDAAISGNPTLTLTTSVSSLALIQGRSGTVGTTLEVSGGFNSPVTLSVTGMPSGVSATFDASSFGVPGSGSAVLTVTASSTATVGSFPLTITARGGGQIKTARVTLAISAPPTFTLTENLATLSVGQGYAGAVTLTTKAGTGFNSAISFSVTGAPTSVTASFVPSSIGAPGTGTSVLKLAAAGSSPVGTYPLTITASGGGAIRTLALSLKVGPSAGCTLTAAPTAVSIEAGKSSPIQVTCANVTGAYAKPLTLKVEGQPSGTTITAARASIAPGTGKSTMTIAPALTATPGSYVLTLSANSADGSLTQSLPLSLTIKPPTTFFITSSQPSLKILQGMSGQVVLTTSHSGAFAGALLLSQTGLPASATASFSTTTIGSPGDGTSTLTIRTATTTPAANYNVVVKATGGGITKTITIPVTVTPLPNFSFGANKTALAVAQTQTGTVNLTVNGLIGGFNSAVNLAVSGLAAA